MARKKHTDGPAKAADPMTQENKSSTKTAPKPPGRPFPPGVSGNPKGRPKTRWELKERIQQRGDDLVDALFDIVDELPKRYEHEDGEGFHIVGPSHRDRIAAIALLKAYAYGKPTQHVEMSGPDGGPIPVKASDELLERAKSILEAEASKPAEG